MASAALGCAPPAAAPLAAFPGTTFAAEGRPSSADALLERAGASALVCVGEQHDEASHHALQAAVLDQLVATSEARGVRLALGMEMFDRSAQPALDAYYRHEIDAAELSRVTDFAKRWGFEFGMYAPMLETARAHGVRIIGLNAHRELTRAVARRGLMALPEPVRASLPELVLDDAEHKAFFWTIMGFATPHPVAAPHRSHAPHGSPRAPHGGPPAPHGANAPHGATAPHGPHPTSGHPAPASPHGHGAHHARAPENMYAAQVIWDETMAEGASAWLADPEPRQIMVVAGNGHCHKSAVPRRVARRRPANTLSVLLKSRGGELPEHAHGDFVVELP